MARGGLCPSCTMGVFCSTWGEWKCLALKKRIYKDVTECKDYVKRPKDWKQADCQCEDCLSNEALTDDIESEGV